MKRYIYLLIVILESCLILMSCGRIPTMNHRIVNVLNLKNLGLESNNDALNHFHYYYTKSFLYVVNNQDKKIIGFNNHNRVFFELGNLESQSQDNSKGWESKITDLVNEMDKDSGKSQESLKKNIPLQEKENKMNDIRHVVRQKYRFNYLGNIAVDNDYNLYVENILKKNPNSLTTTVDNSEEISHLPENNSIINNLVNNSQSRNNLNENEVEILKFSPQGKFLYRIGEEGRDNPSFKNNIQIFNYYFDKNNNMWVRYMKDKQLFFRYYTRYGKNTLFFEEQKIKKAIDLHLMNNTISQKYKIEDIFPMNNKRSVLVVVNYFDSRNYNLKEKQVFILNQEYEVETIWTMKMKASQVFATTNTNLLYFFGYNPQNKSPLVIVYTTKGSYHIRRSINFQFSYYQMLGIQTTGEGDLMGLFLRNNDLLFVLWN